MRKLRRKQGFAPKLVITDKLCSYAAAFQILYRTELGLTREEGCGEGGRRDS